MSQRNRLLLGAAVLLLLVGGLLGLESLRGGSMIIAEGDIVLDPGDIPLYLDGELAAGFTPEDLEAVEMHNFVDVEEGKTQEGWLLRDVLLLNIKPQAYKEDTQITITSSSRGKAVELTWAEVDNIENNVMFDLSGRGTLKLVSTLERLDIRDEWVQDVDKIEVIQP